MISTEAPKAADIQVVARNASKNISVVSSRISCAHSEEISGLRDTEKLLERRERHSQHVRPESLGKSPAATHLQLLGPIGSHTNCS